MQLSMRLLSFASGMPKQKVQKVACDATKFLLQLRGDTDEDHSETPCRTPKFRKIALLKVALLVRQSEPRVQAIKAVRTVRLHKEKPNWKPVG